MVSERTARRKGKEAMATISSSGDAAETQREYEGYVRFADDSVVSLQCFEDRHDECPDITPPGQETDRGGPLEGNYCECSCCPDRQEPPAQAEPADVEDGQL
jgi:hypothetical protein